MVIFIYKFLHNKFIVSRNLGKLKNLDENIVSDIELFLDDITAKHDLNTNDIIKILREIRQKKAEKNLQSLIPISVFSSKKIGCLEALVRYLIDVCGLKKSEAAKLLNRDQRTVWNSYDKARIKSADAIDISNKTISLPLNIFADRNFSVLESIVAFLKEEKGLTDKKISGLLDRSNKTVWTVYSRYKIKLANQNYPSLESKKKSKVSADEINDKKNIMGNKDS